LCSGIQTGGGTSLCAPGFKPDAAPHFVLRVQTGGGPLLCVPGFKPEAVPHFVLRYSNPTRPLTLCSGIQTGGGPSLCAPKFKPEAAPHFVLQDSNRRRHITLCSGIQTGGGPSLCALGFKPEAVPHFVLRDSNPSCCAVTSSAHETARVCVVLFCRRPTGGRENKKSSAHLTGVISNILFVCVTWQYVGLHLRSINFNNESASN
jgi:hypothetical protein